MKPLCGNTKILAHRGASAYSPENTLEAFALAAQMGADGVELDIHYTKDRHVVVIHDFKIDRVSNGQGNIADYTLEELRAFDFGYRFFGERRGIRIPTLREVYELLQPLGLTVNVEIKDGDPAILSDCIRLAEETQMTDKVLYSSFDHLQLQRMKEVDANASIAPLYSFNMLRPWVYGEQMGAVALHPHFGQLTVFPDYVERSHELGLRVHPWTVDGEEDIRTMLALGADAIITNRPDVAKSLRDQMSE